MSAVPSLITFSVLSTTHSHHPSRSHQAGSTHTLFHGAGQIYSAKVYESSVHRHARRIQLGRTYPKITSVKKFGRLCDLLVGLAQRTKFPPANIMHSFNVFSSADVKRNADAVGYAIVTVLLSSILASVTIMIRRLFSTLFLVEVLDGVINERLGSTFWCFRERYRILDLPVVPMDWRED